MLKRGESFIEVTISDAPLQRLITPINLFVGDECSCPKHDVLVEQNMPAMERFRSEEEGWVRVSPIPPEWFGDAVKKDFHRGFRILGQIF